MKNNSDNHIPMGLLVEEKLKSIHELFLNKNAQYSNEDSLANFTTGAKLLYGNDNMCAKYEALKAYAAKHIAHVYNHSLTGPKIKESIGDIAVYFIIAWIMADLAAEEQENEQS